jgi:hypothetical protein
MSTGGSQQPHLSNVVIHNFHQVPTADDWASFPFRADVYIGGREKMPATLVQFKGQDSSSLRVSGQRAVSSKMRFICSQ